MTQKHNLFKRLFSKSLLYRALLGAGIALVLILVFIAGVETQPEWPEQWKIRPLIITPLVGAFGGMMSHLSIQLLIAIKIPKTVAYTLSFIGFVIILWLGTVLGLVGTLWD